MVDCPSDKIKIKYNDRGKGWVVVDGNRYTLNKEIGKSPNLYHAFGTYISKNQVEGKLDCDAVTYWRTSKSHFGSEVADWQPFAKELYPWNIQRNDRSKNSNVRWITKKQYDQKFMNETSGLNIFHWPASYECYNGINQIYGYDFKVTDVIRADKEPDVCTLTIYKDDVIVWQAEYPECPEVEEYCDDNECPPDTCRCEHGSIVCCHDSFTGEVVKRFRRYKNK